MFYSGSPVADAQRYIAFIEQQPIEFDHGCTYCETGFYDGCGVKIGDHKFCNACIKSWNHYDYYRTEGLTDREIYTLTENETKKL
jgi:hypothetical protein